VTEAEMKWVVVLLAVLAAFSPGPARASDAPEAYVTGIQLAKEGRYQEALALLQQVAREHPRYPGLNYNMGNLLFRLAEYSEAEKAYKRAIRDDPGDVDAHYNLAMTYSLLDEMGKALETLQEVVRIRPDDGEAHYRLAMGYFSLRDWERSSFHLQKAKAAGYPVPRDLEKALGANLPSPAGSGKAPTR
jgi:tetratricopeptide (TPR) repeat protein